MHLTILNHTRLQKTKLMLHICEPKVVQNSSTQDLAAAVTAAWVQPKHHKTVALFKPSPHPRYLIPNSPDGSLRSVALFLTYRKKFESPALNWSGSSLSNLPSVGE